MKRKLPRERLLIISVGITFVATGLSIMLAVTSRESVQIGAITTLVTLVLTLGFSAFVAIRVQLEEIDERRIASLPLQRLPSVQEIEPAIVSIVRDVADIKESYGYLLRQMANERVQRAADDIGLLADGVYTCTNKEELPCVRAALADTKVRVRAVAARGMHWWDSADADAYWHAYEEVAPRLEITRVFILHPGEDEDALRRVMDRHAKAGMRTFVLHAARVPQHHIKPVVIFDEHLMHRSGDDRDATDEDFKVEFSSRPADIVAAEETFRVVFDLAADAVDFVTQRSA
jgi:hypothetical protein